MDTPTEDAPSPGDAGSYLTDLEQFGVFDQIAALEIAGPYGYGKDRCKQLWDVVSERPAAAGVQVLANSG
jgi:hypothetical protein